MPKKILYIVNHMECFWTRRFPIAREALAQGWDVGVCSSGAQGDAKLADFGFGAFDLPEPGRKLSPFSMLHIMISMLRVIRKERPDIIHAMTLKYAFMTGLATVLYRREVRIVHTIAGLGYLFSGEGTKPKLLRGLVGPLLKFALKYPRAQVIFQNPDDETLMVRRGFVRPSQCHLIRGSGVDLKAFAKTPLPDDEAPIVLLPTRLVHDKGIAVFIEAARIVKAQGVNARFQIAGGITHNNPLAISQIEMENMVADGAAEWLGKVTDMPALYKASTLICYPSYYGEGVPKVLLEAAAIGRPIITTDHAGCREAVRDGQNGLLVPIKDANACAEAIIELLSDRAKCASMGSASRKMAEEIFDVRLIVKTTLSVYQTARVS